jgi:ABC-type bacteriocin/lantibiotic exporter with double-glycine peptidase domain
MPSPRYDRQHGRSTTEDLPEISLPALTMKRGSYVMLSELGDNQIRYLDMTKSWITETIEAFSEHWDGIAILATADENSGEKDYALNRKKEFINRLRFPFMITALLALLIAAVTAGFVGHVTEITTWLPLLLAK